MMKIVHLECSTIPDAWFQCISKVLDVGFKYEIQHGSYIGQTRLEFDFITVHIKHPYAEPYDLMLPEVPSHLNMPNPVENGYVEQYMPYLMTAHIEPGEQYTYGSRMHSYLSGYEYRQIDLFDIEIRKSQINHWINILKETPNTNQAVLQIAQPKDCELDDPPCLRHVDMRVKNNELIFYPYFRSNDLWGGFPANLAGIAVLQKHMADEIGVTSGPIIYSGKGLHLYGYVEELAKLRTGK
jgi:thymidylate synthase